MPMDRSKTILLASIALLVIIAVGFRVYHDSRPTIYISTTTSLYSTGLLDYLAEKYKGDTGAGVDIYFIPVGSGEALERAARGDVCMVFVHAPRLESEYIATGVLEHHEIIAYNYFVIAGPPDDPAGVRDSSNASDAFRRIYEAGEKGGALFVSRGDRSGTHLRELEIWGDAGLDPEPGADDWYIVTGQGMSNTLLVAEELKAYTLTDIGTYLKLKAEGRLPGLTVLYKNDPSLLNIYSVYLVSTCKEPQRSKAIGFIDYIMKHQSLIEEYGLDTYGTPLFYPAGNNTAWLQTQWSIMASRR